MQLKRAQCQADSSVGLQNHSEEGQRTQEDYLWQVIEHCHGGTAGNNWRLLSDSYGRWGKFFFKEGNQKLEGKDSKKGTQFSAWFCRKQYYRLIREKHWEKEKTLIINFKLFSWNFCCILSIAEVFYKWARDSSSVITYNGSCVPYFFTGS